MAARYMLLGPHYLTTGSVPAGTIITEGIDVPVNWIPTLCVDPLNSDAVTAFYNAGPRHNSWEDLNEFGQVLVGTFIRPVTYWVPVSGSLQWKLTGLGGAIAPRSDN